MQAEREGVMKVRDKRKTNRMDGQKEGRRESTNDGRQGRRKEDSSGRGTTQTLVLNEGSTTQCRKTFTSKSHACLIQQKFKRRLSAPQYN